MSGTVVQASINLFCRERAWKKAIEEPFCVMVVNHKRCMQSWQLLVKANVYIVVVHNQWRAIVLSLLEGLWCVRSMLVVVLEIRWGQVCKFVLKVRLMLYALRPLWMVGRLDIENFTCKAVEGALIIWALAGLRGNWRLASDRGPVGLLTSTRWACSRSVEWSLEVAWWQCCREAWNLESKSSFRSRVKSPHWPHSCAFTPFYCNLHLISSCTCSWGTD